MRKDLDLDETTFEASTRYAHIHINIEKGILLVRPTYKSSS